MVTDESGVFLGSSGGAAMYKSRCSCADAGATTSNTTVQIRFAKRELRRPEAGFNDVRRRATGRRRAGMRRVELSLNEKVFFSDQHRKLRGAFTF